jgi:23S rRNA (guanosine2251-2'-O)-methyltransferase
MKKHPRDTFLTVYGRNPVLEVLQMPGIEVDKIWIEKKAKGEHIQEILEMCRLRRIEPYFTTAQEVAFLSKNPNQDQGVAADVLVPEMNDWGAYLEIINAQNTVQQGIIALDGVTTPANVGLIIRTATGMGMDGILIPRKGVSSLNPLVVKASAGVIFKSRLLKAEQLKQGLLLAKEAGFTIYGLGLVKGAEDLHKLADLAPKSIFVMGNESEGISPQIAPLIDKWLIIRMFSEVESLNVACATAVVCSEWARRKS